MATILDIRNPWRDQLIPAAFRGATFHCEANSLEGGRRLVEHQFPKRDLPYCEDMGHQAYAWSLRAYCISYPLDIASNPLYTRDYRTARDLLFQKLADGNSGLLQVQTLPPMTVWCQRFKLTEEEKFGGYCTFDCTFLEAGVATYTLEDTATSVANAAADLRQRVQDQLAGVAAGQYQGPQPPQLFA
jgi:prophage DNA circulation protein